MQKYIDNLTKILIENNVCNSHGINHAIIVKSHAETALQYETSLSESDKEAVILASLLHDADDKKFFPNNNNYENTRNILSDKPEDFIDLVVQMIKLVSASVNGDNIPAEIIANKQWMLIPRYADRLEAIGIIGIKRCYEYNSTKGDPLYLDTTPIIYDDLKIIEYANNKYKTYQGNSLSMIDHFYDKLIGICNFPIENQYLKLEAEQRRQPLIDFIKYFSMNGSINMEIIK
jgi:uncharacterized protein